MKIPGVLQKLSELLLSRSTEHLSQAKQNIAADIRYHKLVLKQRKVSIESPLVKCYFLTLSNGETVLLNGFLLGDNESLKDTAIKGE